jgi:hypothetical protein
LGQRPCDIDRAKRLTSSARQASNDNIAVAAAPQSIRTIAPRTIGGSIEREGTIMHGKKSWKSVILNVGGALVIGVSFHALAQAEELRI